MDEARVFLADRSNDEAHGAWPGLALINIAGEPPFFVRKALYDRDPKFVRCFTPHRDYPFVPFDQQPMVEVMFTPAHYVELSLAAPVWGEREYVFRASDLPSVGMVDPGEPLGHVEGPDFGFAGREHTQNRIAEHLVARLTSFSRAITFDENDAPLPDYADWRQNPGEPASPAATQSRHWDCDRHQRRHVALELPVQDRVAAALAERWDQRSRALLVKAPEPAEVISVTNTALLMRLRNPLGDATRDAWQTQIDERVERRFRARRKRLLNAVKQLEERLADEVLKEACARHLEHKREAQERRKTALIDWVKQEQNREKRAIKSLAKFIAAALVLSCLTPIGLTKTLELFGAHMSGLRAMLMGLATFTAMMLAYLIRTRRQLGETPIAKIRRFAMGKAEAQLSQLRASDAANAALNPLYERLREDDDWGRRHSQGDIFPEWRWLVWLVRRPPAFAQSERLEWETRMFLVEAASRAGDRTAQPSRKAVLAEMVDRVWPRLRRAIAGLWSDRGRDREAS